MDGDQARTRKVCTECGRWVPEMDNATALDGLAEFDLNKMHFGPARHLLPQYDGFRKFCDGTPELLQYLNLPCSRRLPSFSRSKARKVREAYELWCAGRPIPVGD